MLKELERRLGVKNRYISVPFRLAYGGAWAVYLLTFKKIDFRERVQRMVEPRTFSHADATRDFGYHPLDFADGVTTEVEAFLSAH